ncbi:unnamed protein product [Rhizopus stolonifer]
MSAEILYDKALKSFLLKKHSLAASNCTRAIAVIHDNENLRFNAWMLYLNIASTAGALTPHMAKLLGIKESSSMCCVIWTKLKENYNITSNIDSRLVSSFITMTINLNQLSVAKDIIEEWFTCLSDATLDYVSNQTKKEEKHDVLTCTYIDLVELYVTRILPGLGEFETAETFIEYNTVLTESKLKALKMSVKEYKDSVELKRKIKEEHDKAAQLAVLEAEKRRISEAEMEKEEKEPEPEKEKEEPEASYSNTINTVHQPNPKRQANRLVLLKSWMNQIAIKGALPYATILLIALSLAALLNGQRGRFSNALQNLFIKFYQTIKMGTTVTYM